MESFNSRNQHLNEEQLDLGKQGTSEKRKNNARSCDGCRESHKKCIKKDSVPNCHECSKKGINCKFDIPRKQRGRPIGTSNKEKNVTIIYIYIFIFSSIDFSPYFFFQFNYFFSQTIERHDDIDE